jgi:hypothetical protein
MEGTMKYIPAWLESDRFSQVEREVFTRLVQERVNGCGSPDAESQRRDEEWECLHQVVLEYEHGRKACLGVTRSPQKEERARKKRRAA